MGSLIEDLLKGIADDETLASEMPDINGLRALLDSYARYRNLHDATLPLITDESLGKDFKEALKLLPANEKLTFLNKFNQELRDYKRTHKPSKEMVCRDKDKWEGPTRFLIYAVVTGFFFLALITVISITYLSVNGKDVPSHEFFATIFSTLIELIKIIVGN